MLSMFAWFNYKIVCTLEYRQRDEANKKDNMGKIYILQEMTIIGELSEPTYMVV